MELLDWIVIALSCVLIGWVDDSTAGDNRCEEALI